MRPVSGFFNNVMAIIWNLQELYFHVKESSLVLIDHAEQRYARDRSEHLAMGCLG